MFNKFKHLTFVALMTFSFYKQMEAANILAFFPSSSPSHLIIEMAVARSMSERQHNVTVVSVLPLKLDWLHPNMTHIHLEKGYVDMSFAIDVAKVKGLKKFLKFLDFMKIMSTQMALILEDQKFKELLKNTGNKFDLMLYGYLFGEYFFGLAEHFDCPVALIWPNIPFAPILNMIGSPLAISYTVVSLFNSEVDDSMGFVFRLKNVMAVLADLILYKIEDWRMSQIYAKYFHPEKYCSYQKAKERVVMVLISHHFSEKPVRPLVPAVIEIGGIHINDQPKNLTKGLENFISTAKHGVIYFSMGTNIKEHHLQPHALNKIFHVLSKLPQKILWKVDDESKVPGNSSNILYRQWLPQSDILGHNNIKLFFGHGGKGGITEAKFYGVPIVGLPVYGDQPINMKEVVKKAFGLSIDHHKPLTEELISEIISEVLSNSSYAYNVKKFSLVYRDRPLKAKENAVYWLEYLLRHKKVDHMQSRLRRISLIEAMNLDVIAFSLITLFLVIKVIQLLTKIVCKIIIGKKMKTA